MKEKFEFFVAGVKFHRLRDCIEEVEAGETLEMIPEPTNKYDPNAVQLVYYSNLKDTDFMVGYVPAKISAEVCALCATADAPVCQVTEVIPENPSYQQLRVKIYDVGEEGSKDA